MRSSSFRRAGTVLAVGSLLAGGLLVQSAGQATSAPAPLTDPVQASNLAAELGADRTGGVYYDDSGRLVVAVTDQAAAAAVRAAGGTAQVVSYSTAALNSIHAELDQLAGIPNTSWGVDPSSNQVSIDLHDGVSPEGRARIEAVAAQHGNAVRLEKVQGKLEDTAYEMRGGIGITSSGKICTAGFNVQNSAGSKFLLTAGHCVVGGYTSWNRYNGNIPLGVVTSSVNEGRDYAIIDYTNSNVTPYGTVMYGGTDFQITASRYATDGESVKRTGTNSKDLVGAVLEPSATVTSASGITRYNMIKTSLCGMGGDSGGPLWTSTTALGLLSTTSDLDGPCNSDVSDERTYYQPVQMVLDNYLLKVY